jgi:hypothetical protein
MNDLAAASSTYAAGGEFGTNGRHVGTRRERVEMTLTLAAMEVDAAREAFRSEVRASVAEALSKGRFVPDCDS